MITHHEIIPIGDHQSLSQCYIELGYEYQTVPCASHECIAFVRYSVDSYIERIRSTTHAGVLQS